MVKMEKDSVLTLFEGRFVSDALKVVWLRFISNEEALADAKGFNPDFAHQHFGEKETIYGYENLRFTLNYTDATMFLYPEISFTTAVSSVEKDMKEDDLIRKLKDQLPLGQINMMVESKEQFQILLSKQSKFRPFGQLVTKFTTKEKSLEAYKVSKSSPDFNAYLARVQSLALWYIDAAQYTDNDDPLWLHYLLYESRMHESGDGTCAYSFAGYVSLYRFYAYPDRIRPRVAQIMLLPQYRKSGIGAKLLDVVYKDLCSMPEVLDITAEDPADNFVYLRDYVDCINCSKLPEFSPEKLKSGFTQEMKNVALEKLKITKVDFVAIRNLAFASIFKRQCRRVYEILRLKCTNMKDPEEAKAYRLDVKRRLELPMKRNERDWKKIQRALDDNEYAQKQMDFSFPFVPYEIQRSLMSEIKQCIEEQQVHSLRSLTPSRNVWLQIGIFESPTGTGKSMSVLCATMTWLEDFEKKTEEDLMRKSGFFNETIDDDWISAHKKKMEFERIEAETYEKRKVLDKIKEKVRNAKEGIKNRNRKRSLWNAINFEEGMEPINSDVPENYESEEEFYSNNEEALDVVKIFYASRTHSQLDQLVDELKKTRFLPRVVTAVSRQTLCVNDDVRRLKHNHLINERCMELRKACTREGKRVKLNEKANSNVGCSANKCPYYKSDAIEELSNEIIAGVLSRPKEIVQRGKEFLACPYFSTRLSLPLCQLVLLPYQVLLHASTRAAWGIRLKGNVLVFDEAHNILGTIGRRFHVTWAILESQLKSKNLMYMRQLLTIVVAMDQFLRKNAAISEELGLTDINLFKIVHYLDATDMCRKFHGFFIRAMNRKVALQSSSASQGGIAKLMAGKNAATRLMEVVNEARATIFIGGTMEPADLLIKSIAETVVLIMCEVPNGCVVFFTSYDNMSTFLSVMKKFRVIEHANMNKEVFVETRASSEGIWDKFVIASRRHEGAVLFAVAGGKLSEGINFSDELGRAVFMIGLPYPNKNSVELKEKMAYLDSQIRCGGNKFYQSLCMHVVNQAIGRAIRHQKDYAAVYLVDHRFTRQDITSALPRWIREKIQCPNSFTEALSLTKTFFKNKM
ncbi:DNA repair helicase [Dictyocaulus viviparus]|uniref:Histone acetyltransferase type B catalytic subunit n=1 Tax=Dictyocaulus viviparus TaxID=29172 RepID=A0A0D8YEN8_DICVI|nr:DNA repair helicase [Dictyocaulus viviparus]